MRYKHILVAVDGSDTSNLALQEAIQLTKDQKAVLRIIYVVDEAVVKYNDGLWISRHFGAPIKKKDRIS